jgi:hypothetical protein
MATRFAQMLNWWCTLIAIAIIIGFLWLSYETEFDQGLFWIAVGLALFFRLIGWSVLYVVVGDIDVEDVYKPDDHKSEDPEGDYERARRIARGDGYK